MTGSLEIHDWIYKILEVEMVMNKEVKKSSEIKIRVGLNDQGFPVKIQWIAEDNPSAKKHQDCKAMLLSMFDESTRDTLKIDFWTTEMQVVEMDRFMYQTLRGLADTYMKATQNRELATEMQQFVRYFGEKTEILPKE